MLVVTLAILFFPLRQGLVQVRDEGIARTAVRDALRILGPPDAFLTQQLEILPDRILARLVVTMAIDPAKIRQAERLVIARTGKPTNFVVRQVASQDEIALLESRGVQARSRSASATGSCLRHWPACGRTCWRASKVR